MDYIDLNEACPKDSFPLPRINQIVDATSGHKLLSFLDAFSRYHQIPCTSQRRENDVHYTTRALLLQCDVFWLEECHGNLSKVDK